MKALLVGYGSIGRKHVEILRSIEQIDKLGIVTKQLISGDHKIYKDLEAVKDINQYDYFVIASETYKHYKQLKFLCSRVSKKKILVEKPLFEGRHRALDLNQNDVYVAYNLRYNPVIQRIKELLQGERVISAHIYCGQFLPHWRSQIDYRKTYSASLEKGGGVLRDLSHELDYSSWLFGRFIEFTYINEKLSNLEIDSDDIYSCLGKTNMGAVVNLSVDYISKKAVRKIIAHSERFSVYADLVGNAIEVVDDQGVSESLQYKTDKLQSYVAMHKDILFSKKKQACAFDEGCRILDLFSTEYSKKMQGDIIA